MKPALYHGYDFFSIVVGKITLSYSFCTKYDIYRLLDFQYIQKCNDFKDVCTHILLSKRSKFDPLKFIGHHAIF